MKFLCAVLNSSLIRHLVPEEQVAPTSGIGYLLRWKKDSTVQGMPIPKSLCRASSVRSLTSLDRILAAKDSDRVYGQNPPDTSALEAEVDQLVYELYGLTEEEVAAVDSQGIWEESERIVALSPGHNV